MLDLGYEMTDAMPLSDACFKGCPIAGSDLMSSTGSYIACATSITHFEGHLRSPLQKCQPSQNLGLNPTKSTLSLKWNRSAPLFLLKIAPFWVGQHFKCFQTHRFPRRDTSRGHEGTVDGCLTKKPRHFGNFCVLTESTRMTTHGFYPERTLSEIAGTIFSLRTDKVAANSKS